MHGHMNVKFRIFEPVFCPRGKYMSPKLQCFEYSETSCFGPASVIN